MSCSFSLLFNYCDFSLFSAYILLYPQVWADKYNVLSWCLFVGWFSIGIHLPLYRISYSLILHVFVEFYDVCVNTFDWTGHECQSPWNCAEIDIFWNESINISTNLGIYHYRSYLRGYTNQLSKQGSVLIVF